MAYSIKTADREADQATVLSLWEENLRRISGDRYQWIYRENPVNPVHCWVVSSEDDGEAAGTLSLFARDIRCGDRVVHSALPGYFAVSKKHRVLGPALLLLRTATKACDADGFEFTYGCPNAASEPLLARLGHRRLGSIRVYSKILRSSYVLARIMPRPLAHAIGSILDIPLRLWTKRPNKAAAAYRVESVQKLDERVDKLWQKSSGWIPVTGVRTSEYLNWRYASCPHKPFQMYQAIGPNEEVVAYFASWQDGESEALSDFYAKDAESLDAALWQYSELMRSKGRNSIVATFFGSDRIDSVLRRNGFLMREAKENVYIYGKNPPEADDPQNWFLTEGETHY